MCYGLGVNVQQVRLAGADRRAGFQPALSRIFSSAAWPFPLAARACTQRTRDRATRGANAAMGPPQSEFKQESTELTESGKKSLSVGSVRSCLNSLSAPWPAIPKGMDFQLCADSAAMFPRRSDSIRPATAQSGSVRLNPTKSKQIFALLGKRGRKTGKT